MFLFIFFGQNLKFLRLSKIWYRGTLLYAYFNVSFFTMFVIHPFWANLVLKFEVL